MDNEELEYMEAYGYLPNTTEELLKYMEDNYKLDMDKINEEEQRINNIKWNTIKINLPLIPKGSPRPRKGIYGNFYVKGASKLKKKIRSLITTSGLIITRVHYIADIYMPTPKSTNNTYKYLAEKKLIRPMTVPDWDNFGKNYSDPLIDNILLDDRIIATGIVNKYYSIKPRVEITLKYQESFDSKYNEKLILNSEAFKKIYK